MKRNTIQRGLSDRTIDGGDVTSVVTRLMRSVRGIKGVKDVPAPAKNGNVTTTLNDEVVPVLKELRTKANLELREEGNVVTAGLSGYTEVWRSPPLETNGTYGLSAEVKWSNADQSVWARATISNSLTSSNGVVALTMLDYGEIHYSDIGLRVRWQADSTNRQAYLEVADIGAPLTARAVVTMGAREV